MISSCPHEVKAVSSPDYGSGKLFSNLNNDSSSVDYLKFPLIAP